LHKKHNRKKIQKTRVAKKTNEKTNFKISKLKKQIAKNGSQNKQKK